MARMAVFGAAPPVHAAREVVKEEEQIGVGPGLRAGVHGLIENHDPPAICMSEESEEPKSESGKAVAAGSHKRELDSLLSASQ